VRQYKCRAGSVPYAFDYLKQHYAMYESSYPYTGVEGDSCQYTTNNNSGIEVKSYQQLKYGDKDAMIAALQTNVLSVAVSTNNFPFQHYKRGIMTSQYCGIGDTDLDHYANVVGMGYDEDRDMQYWVMRNSWGASWGESGYMRLEIVDGPGRCGIQTYPYVPTL